MVSTLLPGRNIPYKGPEKKEEDVHGDYLPLPETDLKKRRACSVLVDRHPYEHKGKDNYY